MIDVSVTVSGSFGVSFLQTNTNTSIQTSNVIIISKKKREEGISDPEHWKREEVPKTVNSETIASQWLRAELQR
jgi:hypothetical protein